MQRASVQATAALPLPASKTAAEHGSRGRALHRDVRGRADEEALLNGMSKSEGKSEGKKKRSRKRSKKRRRASNGTWATRPL